MNLRFHTSLIVAAFVALLAVASSPSASAGPVTARSDVDGTIIDLDGDGSGDYVYNGVGSVIVGYNAHFGAGEYRGVYDFGLDDVVPCAAGFSAELRLSLTGTWNVAGDPNHSLYAAPGDGALGLGDYSAGSFLTAFDVYDTDSYPIKVIDVSGTVQAASSGGLSHLTFIVRPNPASASILGAFLYSSNEISDVYGFTPTVLVTDCAIPTAAYQVDGLIALIESYDLEHSLGTSLTDKLITVQRLLEAGKPRQAVEAVGAFMHQAMAQSGKALTVGQAEQLTAAAEAITAAIAYES